MTLRVALVLVLMTGCRPPPPGVEATGPPGSPTDHAAEILRLDSLWFAGYEDRDTMLVDRVLASTFSGNVAGTEIDRSGALARVRENTWDRYTLDWVDVDVRGDVALIRAHRTAYRSDDGQEITSRFAYLDVYVWEGTQWRCVTGQSSAISE